MNNSSKKLREAITLVDRISNLPDDLLCHILSLLKTKQAVATSILSKRWEFLWTYVEILDFDHYEFPTNKEVSRNIKFAQFVNRVMELHRATRIKRMRLECNGNKGNEYDVVTWIRTAVFREVQSLDLCLSYFNFKLPLCFFYSQTLVELTLFYDGMINMNIPSAPFFPNLKKLHLTYPNLSPSSLESFILGCPVLECLFLEHECGFMRSCLHISSATLKKFDYHGEISCVEKPQLVLNTPALEFIKIEDIFENLELFVKNNMSSLREAHVPFDLNQFCYLKCLPNVEVLSLTCLERTGGIWEEPESVPECLLSSLHTIYIKGYGNEEEFYIKGYGNEEEVELMIKYILANAKVLKSMEIHMSDSVKDYEHKFHMVRKITMFPRASGICEILFF